MSRSYTVYSTQIRQALTGLLSLGVISSAALSPSVAVAQTATGLVDTHWIQNHSERSHSNVCVRVNGAQIIGGFASSDDWINPETGALGRSARGDRTVKVC